MFLLFRFQNNVVQSNENCTSQQHSSTSSKKQLNFGSEDSQTKEILKLVKVITIFKVLQGTDKTVGHDIHGLLSLRSTGEISFQILTLKAVTNESYKREVKLIASNTMLSSR